jgi:hypothetical protein
MRDQKVFFGVFAGIGLLLFLVALIVSYFTYQKVRDWKEAEAIITQTGSGNTYFSFSHNGEPMEVHSNYSSGALVKGESITVHYPEGEPANAEIKSFVSLWILPLIFGGIGLIFGSIGAIGVYFRLQKEKLKQELFVMGKGKKVSIPVTHIDVDKSYTVNGKNPFLIIIEFHHSASNTLYEFKSDHIWFDPSPFLPENKEVNIYFDENDLSRYYIDVSFLPKQA